MINLLPPEYKQSIKFAQLNVVLARYIVVALITSVVVGGVMLFGVQAAENNRRNIQNSLSADIAQASELESTNKEAQKLADNIDVIAELLDSEIQFSELLREIGSVIPAGVALADLTITDDQTEPLLLEVDARSEAAIGVFLENLNNSELFAGGEITLIQRLGQPKEGTGYQYSGSIKAFFSDFTALTNDGGSDG